MKKLFIVCDEKTEKYGNFFRQLISQKANEPDVVNEEKYDVAVWNEKQYADNVMKISAHEHFLFIGINKTSKKEIGTMDLLYDQYGMKYGWLGTRGALQVDSRILTLEEYNLFIDYAANKKMNIEKIAYKKGQTFFRKADQKVLEEIDKKKDKKVNVLEKIEMGLKKKLINWGSPIDDKADDLGMVMNGEAGKIKDQQYKILVNIFYNETLKKFMEG